MMMTRTLNLMFANMEKHLETIATQERGSFQRTAELEKLAEQLPIFIAMAADLAVMVEDLTTDPAERVRESNESRDDTDDDGKGMYL